ncbi:DUF86 domain-containing protein [Bradyrhizobium genosp. L]|uniref:HepT-like ribonuclease domain-containing protein n=1 Tax=Bradyrhizobium genosp. L TaxID=83637 RepID=UPI0018A3260E|nr:HepT-like ribonuclease domain-containing protein [Bradyrhizobium genosp. L]QPF86956.1 DUF86 domain-containing protein [Bradyrhizobium genosp. L]
MTEMEIVPSIQDRFAHILSAINIIQVELRECSESELANDRSRRLALERLFEMVSVACGHIPYEIKAAETAVDWRCFADIGARLENTRVRIEPEILWGIAGEKLVPLKTCVERRIRA